MIVSISPVWDETIVLPQRKIGELVLYARRKGTTWFLAAMNGSPIPKKVNVNLSFLKKLYYSCYSVSDDKSNQANASLDKVKVSASSVVTISMNASGGFVVRLEPVKD